LSVCPTIRRLHAAGSGLLLSARRARDIDRLLHGAQQAPVLSSSGAAARRSAANAGSVTVTADVEC